MQFSSERVSEEYLVLNSCGIERFYDIDGKCRRPNGRMDYHILYVKEGFCYLTVQGITQILSEGAVVLFRPGQPQQYDFKAKDKSVSFYIHFTGSGCGHILNKMNFPEGYTVDIGKNSDFEETFEKLLKEYRMKQCYSELYCGGVLAELLAIVARAICNKEMNLPDKNKAIVEKACMYIYRNLKDVTLEELAKNCYLSVGRFSHIFKDAMGVAPLEYITEMRLQKAKDMLINTDFPIGKIACDSGYEDQNYFSRLFKKHFGVTPSKYRTPTMKG